MSIVIAALYKFIDFPDYKEWQPTLKQLCLEQKIRGTLLLASEGINGTVAGPRAGIDLLLSTLKKDARLKDLEHKESYAESYPFYRLKVRLKKEIVTLGIPGLSPAQKTGTYVKPEDWNDLISQPDVVLLETRNDYEVAIGKFKGFIDPKITTFREFPAYVRKNLDPKKHKKIAMDCTGGIRCEKASAFMLAEGFEEVYQLEGGILKYLETVPSENSLWEGECFVFDNRVAVTEGVEHGHFGLCFGCRHPIDDKIKKSSFYEEGVSCPQCCHKTSDHKKNRLRERQKQIALARTRHQCHLGQAHEPKITGNNNKGPL